MYVQLDAADANLQRPSEAGYQGRALQESARIDSLRRATIQLDSLMSAGAVEAATAYFQGVKPIFTRTQESLSPP